MATTLLQSGFASNGYGEHSPEKFSMISVIVTEAVLTFVFVMVILGATDWRAPRWNGRTGNRTLFDSDSHGLDSNLELQR